MLLDGDYITVHAKDREFRGVPLREWVGLLADLRRRFGEQADIDFRKFVAPALLDIERTNRTAEAALLAKDNVGPSPKGMEVQQEFWTSERFRMLEQNIRVRIVHDRDPEAGKAAPSIGGGTLGRGFVRLPDSPPTTLAPVGQPATPAPVAHVPSDSPVPSTPTAQPRLKFRED
ncbi:MAG: hypothetical protein EON58_07435 [Alphaproteobacteria bacterium]|nr:MAG: hypothetical protein EON58_07435 [Alphaproteobacteria bacterium]